MSRINPKAPLMPIPEEGRKMRHSLLKVIPRNGHVIRILLIVRVSCPGEGKQDIRSLDDQEKLLREYVRANIREPYEIVVISGTGSGENLSRPEFLDLCARVESKLFDLILVEDLARIARRLATHEVCELCIDCGCRLISLNDNVDTADEGWEDRSIFAAWHHQRSNRDTSARIKRSLNNHFENGGALSLPIFGYIKPPGAKSDADVQKDPAAESVYREWFRRLEEGASFSSIADWLNAEKIPTGPYVQKETWTGTIVGSTTRNPILKGARFHNRRESYRVNNPGIYKTRAAAPESQRTRIVPHLAFFPADYYDRVLALVNERNAKYKRGDSDPLLNRPKKRTRYPGQCIYCGVCGRMFVFGGHGQTNHLMCDGARAHLCWNGATVDGPLAASKISTAVCRELETLIGYDAEFLASVNAEANRLDEDKEQRSQEVARHLKEVSQAIERLLKMVMGGQVIASVTEKLEELEARKQTLLRDQDRLQRRRTTSIQLPPINDLKQLACEKMASLAIDSFEYAAFIRQLTPRIVVFPVRLIDGGKVVLRAHFNLQLAELIADADSRDAARPSLLREVRIDLFDHSQREEIRLQVVAARAGGDAERKIAASLGVTITAAQRAMTLQRMMDARGVSEPYEQLLTPPDGGKIQRHRHPRYNFSPLPSAGEL